MDILCVAAHPDDEVLGAGGTLRKHAAAGDSVHLLFMNAGVMSRYTEETDESRREIEERKQSASNAAEVLGVESVSYCEFPNNRMDQVALLDVVKQIEAKIADLSPSLLYTNYFGDLNIDHEVTARAVKTATRPMAESPVDRVLGFETLSSTEWSLPKEGNAFQPTLFNDISDYLTPKMEALDAYQEELREHPHPRNRDVVESNARLWGAKSGLEAAEPFEVIFSRQH